MGVLDAIKRALSREQRLRKRWRKIAADHRTDIHELRKAIHEVNLELAKLRARRKEKREEGDDEKAEKWADEIEELEDHKDDLLLALHDKRGRLDTAEKNLADHQDRVRALLKKREARREARAGKGNLSPHFSIEEFGCRDGTPVPSYMRSSLEALCREHLEPLRNAFGKPIRVNSGYRTASYNASIGGASQSYHIYDLRKRSPAADHIVDGVAAGSVQRWYDSHTNPDGMGYYAGFTHIDDRGYRSRWYGAG